MALEGAECESVLHPTDGHHGIFTKILKLGSVRKVSIDLFQA